MAKGSLDCARMDESLCGISRCALKARCPYAEAICFAGDKFFHHSKAHLKASTSVAVVAALVSRPKGIPLEWLRIKGKLSKRLRHLNVRFTFSLCQQRLCSSCWRLRSEESNRLFQSFREAFRAHFEFLRGAFGPKTFGSHGVARSGASWPRHGRALLLHPAAALASFSVARADWEEGGALPACCGRKMP